MQGPSSTGGATTTVTTTVTTTETVEASTSGQQPLNQQQNPQQQHQAGNDDKQKQPENGGGEPLLFFSRLFFSFEKEHAIGFVFFSLVVCRPHLELLSTTSSQLPPHPQSRDRDRPHNAARRGPAKEKPEEKGQKGNRFLCLSISTLASLARGSLVNKDLNLSFFLLFFVQTFKKNET